MGVGVDFTYATMGRPAGMAECGCEGLVGEPLEIRVLGECRNIANGLDDMATGLAGEQQAATVVTTIFEGC